MTIESEASSALALESVLVLLQRRLGPWIGHDACALLLQRAMSATVESHRAAPVDPTRFVDAFLERLLRHLARLIGQDMAIRLIAPETNGHDGRAP